MTKTKHRGAQPGNQNAVRHGAYLQRVDGRTRFGKAQRQIEAALVGALGGDPSPQEIIILQRAAMKTIRCWTIERELLSNKAAAFTLEAHYLRWARELREDLKALGLKRQPKPVEDLETYVTRTYGE